MRKQNRPWHFHHIYKAFFLCELIGGIPATSNETLDVGFFEQENLPELSTARVTHEEIVRLFEHREHPEWPTDFD